MSVINSYPKIFDSRNLQSWVNCVIKFELTTGEHLTGKLQSLDSKTNVFHFVDLKKDDGTPCYLTQNYSYRDFQGKFICLTQNVSVDIDDFKVQQAERSLLAKLEEKNETFEVVENDDDFEADEMKPAILDVPPSAEIEFESIEFDFILDPETFESSSNAVVRFDSVNAPDLPEAISTLKSSSIVGFTCLPWSINRDTPIDFAIFGCDKGTFVFPIIPGMMSKLKEVVESEDICKVMHNCSVTAARLYKLYKVDLNNVDDTLVWDCELGMRNPGKYGRRKEEIKPYDKCVAEYLQIDLPWSDKENFYEVCGKGKLLSKPLDETGASYARSLVMLLSELRTEMLKHLFFPTLMKQYHYLNNVKYISPQEYTALRSMRCFSPYYLTQGEMVDVEGINFASIPVISDILSEKFKFYNVVFSRKTKSVGLQCQLKTRTEKMSESYPVASCSSRKQSDGTTNDSAISSDEASQPNSSPSSQLSPTSSLLSQSPETSPPKNVTRYPHVTKGNNSSAIKISHGLIHGKDNHDSPINQPTSHDELTYEDKINRRPRINTNHPKYTDRGNFIDWSVITDMAVDRPGTSKLYPAGFNPIN